MMAEISPEPDPKRRKLRKGTTSCWDCKKRKVRCTYDAPSDIVCSSCRRRGAACISQDQSQPEIQPQTQHQSHHCADDTHDVLLHRLQRVETLLERLVERDQQPPSDSGYFTPATDYHQSIEPVNRTPRPYVADATSPPITGEERKLSEELVKAFPSQQDIDVFCKSDYIATFYCHQIFTKLGDRPEHEAVGFVNRIALIPDPSMTPPALVAKRMITFALFLQYFQCHSAKSLAENPSLVMERLIDTAVRLVTTNETLVACYEGLESIIFEGVFHSNAGNLRRAWLAFRRAMTIAQLMKIDHPNPPPLKSLEPDARPNPKFLWFRIVYMDSHLSLMLGLPHGGQDTNMMDEIPGEGPSCKLERVHTLIARGINDRNRRGFFLHDFAATQNLDRELLKVANAVPDKFLLPVNFTALQPNTRQAFWETMRLCNQLHHYNLVHLVHLPYLLHSERETSFHNYARITCMNASREILSRLIAFRDFTRNLNKVYCRSGDFIALMAAMTLLLAHIDGHRLEVEDWRAHQRLGDRAMVGQLLETLERMVKHTDDMLTRKSAEQLRSLLDIESDTARGMGHSAHTAVCSLEESCGELHLSIPYFGIIKICRQGIIKDGRSEPDPLSNLSTQIPGSVHVANHFLSLAGFSEFLQQSPQSTSFSPVPGERSTRAHTDFAGVHVEGQLHEPQSYFPALAADINDWAFQGVDAAFFDSVMRGTVDWDQAVEGAD